MQDPHEIKPESSEHISEQLALDLEAPSQSRLSWKSKIAVCIISIFAVSGLALAALAYKDLDYESKHDTFCVADARTFERITTALQKGSTALLIDMIYKKRAFEIPAGQTVRFVDTRLDMVRIAYRSHWIFVTECWANRSDFQ